MKRKKIIIVGGSSFIGKNLIGILKDEYKVYSVTKSSDVQGVENIKEDLGKSSLNFIEKIKPQYIVWLATTSSPKEGLLNPQECFMSNVVTVQRFLEKAKDLDINKIILLSSAVLYQDKKKGGYKENDKIEPYSSIYNYSKYLMESLRDYYQLNHGLNITVFRLSNTYGPHQTTKKASYLIPTLFEQAKNKKQIEIWNADPVRDWIYVEDVALAIKEELKKKDSGIFNLGTGIGTSVGKLSRIVARIYGRELINLNKKVEPPFRVVLDLTALKKHLGFIPSTSLEEGIYKTHLHYDNR